MTDLEFQDLIDRSLEGTLMEADARRLWKEVRADEGRRSRFVKERELHHDLGRLLTPGAGDGAFLHGVLAELSAKRQDEESFARAVVVRARRPRAARPHPGSPLPWTFAAAALLAVGLLAVVLPGRTRIPEAAKVPPPAAEPREEFVPQPPSTEEAPRPKAPEPPRVDVRPVPVPVPAPAPPPVPAPPVPVPAPPNASPPEPPPAPTRAAIARAERVRGDAVHLDGTPLKEGTDLLAGQGIRSVGEHSLVAFRFPDGTYLQLGGDTTVRDLSEADAKNGKAFTLSAGVLYADVPRQPAGRPLFIHTPHARAVVLGTQFALAVTAEATAVEVEEGRVRLVRDDGAQADVGKDQHALASRAVTPSAKPLASLLQNPSFDKLGQGWMMFRPDGAPLAGRRTVSGGVRGAGHALEIQANTTFPHQVWQDAAAVAGASYSLRGWIKSKDLQGGRVEILWLNAAGLSDNPAPSAILRTDVVGTTAGTVDWLKAFGRFRAPAGSKAVRVRVVTDAGTGWLWADEFRLARAAP